MINNLIRYFIVSTIFFTVVYTQNRVNVSGVSLDGSTGLLLNPSTETLSVGHVRLGTSQIISTVNQSFETSTPLSISLGLTGRTELFYSTNSWNINNKEREKSTTLGTRIKALSLGSSQTSLEFRWQNSKLFTENQLSLENQRLISKAISSFSIFNLKSYANIGYITSLKSTDSNYENRFIGGIGVLLPIIKQVNGIIDFQVDEHLSNGNEIVCSIGIKWFLLKHIQLASGINTAINETYGIQGIFLNLSFSSEVMTGARRRIRTKKGLPVPPKLPKNYFTELVVKDVKLNNIEELEPSANIPLTNYVNNFLNMKYIGEPPLIPPISKLEQWLIEVNSGLSSKKHSELVIKSRELPIPPLLEEIGIPWTKQTEKQKPVNSETLTDEIIINLPMPPSFESLNKKKYR